MNYVAPQHELATTVVEDKFGIIPLVNDLLLAVHYADMSSTNFDDDQARKNDITNNIAVADTLSQFELASIALSQELGGSLTDSAHTATTPRKERDAAIDQLDADFMALFGNIDAYTRAELLIACDTFGVKVTSFIKAHGNSYHDETMRLESELSALKNVIDDPDKAGKVRTNGGDWQPATLDDYVEFVQARIHDLYI